MAIDWIYGGWENNGRAMHFTAAGGAHFLIWILTFKNSMVGYPICLKRMGKRILEGLNMTRYRIH